MPDEKLVTESQLNKEIDRICKICSLLNEQTVTLSKLIDNVEARIKRVEDKIYNLK